MAHRYVTKTYHSSAPPDILGSRLSESILERDFSLVGQEHGAFHFQSRSIRFSSTKPLTCISRLTLSFLADGAGTIVRAEMTFTRIKYFLISVLVLLCVAAPMALGMFLHGVPDIPPTSYLGIPVGFMVHYHVRGRVFRALGRLIRDCGEAS
jgi:hypothetical protein